MFSFNNDYKVLQFFPMVVLICYFYISMTISLMLLKLKPKNALLLLFLNNKTGIITGHIVMTSLQYYQGNFYPFLICKFVNLFWGGQIANMQSGWSKCSLSMEVSKELLDLLLKDARKTQ